VVDAATDAEGRLWVVSAVPEKNWEEDLGEAPGRPFGKRFVSDDFGLDGLVEVFDSTGREALASFRLDPLVRFIVGPGMLAYYEGDLPYPRFAIIKIPLNEISER
jgi:hypothetical protein